ncbi:MAG: hypothetical protein KFW21_07135 [Spirochaetota bacterium]|nr:hypothetical protein [Spirochaetota bacterium]
MTPVKDIFQDSVKIIGKIAKLDCLRYGTTGLASLYFVLSLPSANEEILFKDKVKRDIYIPCTIYGDKAEELGKLVTNRKIKLGDSLEIIGSHRNIYKDKHTALEIKVNHFEEIQDSLFTEEIK